MQLRIRALGLDLSPETRLGIERRLRLALGRRGADVSALDVTLCPGPESAREPTRRCRIRARLREGAKLAIDEDAPDLGDAVAAAAWRLDQRLSRARARFLHPAPEERITAPRRRP